MKRKRKVKKDRKLTLEEIEELRFKDWCGELAPDEVAIARKHGVLDFDLLNKCWNMQKRYHDEISRLCKEKWVSGFNLAPRFKADGTIRDSEKKYLITNHAEFEKLLERLNSNWQGRTRSSER